MQFVRNFVNSQIADDCDSWQVWTISSLCDVTGGDPGDLSWYRVKEIIDPISD